MAPRIEILGVFGAGKTTLARKLAHHGMIALEEDHRQNRFWGDTELTGTTGYLPYDLVFLLEHIRLAAMPLPKNGHTIGICDWSLATDRLWASMRLDEEFQAYDAVHQRLIQRVAPPIGYLYIRQAPKVILANIQERGRREESTLTAHIETAATRLNDLVATLPLEKILTIDGKLDPAAFAEKVRQWRSSCLHG